MTLRDGDRVGGQAKVRMERGPLRVLDAVRWPGSARGMEASMLCGMPISGGEDRCASLDGILDPAVQDRHDIVALLNRKRSAWAEVLLHIHQDERVTRTQRLRRIHSTLHPSPRIVLDEHAQAGSMTALTRRAA